MMQLHRDPRQALRAGRVLLGVVAYLMWMSVGSYLYIMDMMRVDLAWLIGYFSLMLLTNLGFLLAIRLNWNLRFHDPGMTMGQIAFGIFWGMVLMSQALPEARGGMLLVFVTGFFFGVFRLNTRQFLALTLFASLIYAGLIRLEWEDLDAETRQIEMSQWVFLSLVLLWMSFMGGYVARLRANLRTALRRIEELANRDHLTGTGNRRSITGNLSDAIAAAETGEETLSVALMDLDHFKELNDRYGHLCGDAVLKQFVQRIEGELRGGDVLQDPPEQLGRFGGEEFLVVLRGTDKLGAKRAAERLRAAIAEQTFETESGPAKVTVSIGVAEFRPGDSTEDLLRRADRCLYQAKDEGRNRVVLAD